MEMLMIRINKILLKIYVHVNLLTLIAFKLSCLSSGIRLLYSIILSLNDLNAGSSCGNVCINLSTVFNQSFNLVPISTISSYKRT